MDYACQDPETRSLRPTSQGTRQELYCRQCAYFRDGKRLEGCLFFHEVWDDKGVKRRRRKVRVCLDCARLIDRRALRCGRCAALYRWRKEVKDGKRY